MRPSHPRPHPTPQPNPIQSYPAQPAVLPQTPRLKKEHWRKSNQFFGLTRKHAELVAADSEVFQA